MKSLLSPLLALLFLAGSAQAQEFIRLNDSGKSLNAERGVLELSGVKKKMQGAMWEKLQTGQGLFVLRNRLNGQYLVCNNNVLSTTSQEPSRQGTGPHYWRYTQPRPGEPSILTSVSGLVAFELEGRAPVRMLQVEEVTESQTQTPPAAVEYRLVLSSKQAPLHIENGPPIFGRMDPGAPGCMWQVKESSNGPEGGLYMMFVNRKSGQVLSSSGTTLTTQAPGPIETGREPFFWRAVQNGQYYELTNSQGARLTGISLQPVR